MTEIAYINAPSDGEFGDIVWSDKTNKVIVNYRDSNDAWAWKLHAVNLDGSNFVPLPIPNDPECKHTSHHLPRVLADGRLAYVEECWGSRTRGVDEGISLKAYDFDAQVSKPLLSYYLPHGTRSFAMAPDLDKGVLMSGSLLHNDLYWILPHGLERLELPFELPGRVSWSPDGQLVIINAVPQGISAAGPARLVLPEQLYLFSATDGRMWSIADGFVGAGEAAWSPDSHWIVLEVSQSADPDSPALWLIEASTGRRFTLMSGLKYGTGYATWLPDNQRLARSVIYESEIATSLNRHTSGLQILALPNLDQYATAPTSAK